MVFAFRGIEIDPISPVNRLLSECVARCRNRRERLTLRERPHPARGTRRPSPEGRGGTPSRSLELKSGCRWRNCDRSKRAEMQNFYHRLWFWRCCDLPIASFRQNLFWFEAGNARFRGRMARAVGAVGCPYVWVALGTWRHKGEQFTPELSWNLGSDRMSGSADNRAAQISPVCLP